MMKNIVSPALLALVLAMPGLAEGEALNREPRTGRPPVCSQC